MTRGNKFFFGLAVGAFTGVLAGMLMAPRTGRETRKAIQSRAGELGFKTRRLMRGRKAAA